MKHGKSFVSLLVVGMLLVAACDQKAPPPTEPKAQNKKADCPDLHDHGAGPPIELGTVTAGGFTIKAARDNFPVKPSCDVPADVWITAPAKVKVTAVRFWIGTEDAKGSIKALAEIENPAEPNHWHTHAEIPDPIPAGSKLWVEVEGEGGAKATVSFDLKT